MKRRWRAITLRRLALLAGIVMGAMGMEAQTLTDEDGNSYDTSGSTNFNKHNNDTTRQKEIPKGMWTWKIDRRFGDATPTVPDTLPHLFQNTIFNTGLYGQYLTTGNNYTARLNRIVADRDEKEQFMFTQVYDHVMKDPDELQFINTLSPITNISYDNCGNKTNGEDHIDAVFATNVNKRLGFGFDINYAYARGYYQNQSTSHFGFTLFGSYRGNRYDMHAMLSTYHQKVSENGGITDDYYITHPETFSETFMSDEIPVVLEQNWNRNTSFHLFLGHRYNVGFYRMEKMTDEEIKAREFAKASMKDNEQKKREQRDKEGDRGDGEGRPEAQPWKVAPTEESAPAGRPDGAKIMGDEPAPGLPLGPDTTRVSVEDQQRLDSLMLVKAMEDSIAATMKRVYVPVTSFIHTLDLNKHNRIYQAYDSPTGYYANTYYDLNADDEYSGDSIFDQTRFLSLKNTVAIALMEGFNKWAKAGVKLFASHELRQISMPDIIGEAGEEQTVMADWSEHNLSVGAQINKTQGHTLHYDLLGEAWIAGEDMGQLKIDFQTDLNFPLWGDTLRLAAKAHFYRLNPTFYERQYHSKHLWWDNSLEKETRTGVEGIFSLEKTHTRLRVAIEEIQNYTYFGMAYDATTSGRTSMTAGVYQAGGNINLMTAQLLQDFRLGPLNWENIITYQNSSDEGALPVPTLNIFTNLYLKFKIARELLVELGGDMYYFTKYYAPDYCASLGQYAVQMGEESRVKVGGYPFVDVYANMHLKHTRFFIMMSHVNGGSGSREYFLAPHYPQNGRLLRFGLSWNFFN